MLGVSVLAEIVWVVKGEMLAEEVSGTASGDQGRIDSLSTSQAKKEIKIYTYIYIYQ